VILPTISRIFISVVLVLSVHPFATADDISATVVIDADSKIQKYDPMIFGGFIEHFHRQVYGGIFEPGSPLSDERGFRTDVIEALKELNMPVVRWPGGCFASAYHWVDAVGPKRTPAFDKAWRVEDPNTFGTDEFVLWCRAIGAEPYICVNAGTGTLEEMSDWVEYCNQTVGKWAALRRANGFDEPHNVKYWSIGNENWGLHEPVTRSKEEWPMLVREGAQLMLAVDPSIQLFAPVVNDPDWALPTLKVAGRKLNFVSIHGYWDALWGNPQPSTYMKAMSWARMPEDQIVEMKGLLNDARMGNIKIAFDEWNLRSWHHPNAPDGRASAEDIAARDIHDRNSDYTMADALFSAGFFNACLRNADAVTMANVAPIVNARGPLFVHPKGLVKRTTFHVMNMYANGLESHVAEAAIESDLLYDEAKNIPAVDALATCDEEKSTWRIALINRHPRENAEIRLKLGGSAMDGTYPASLLSGDSENAFNGIEHPDRVEPKSVEIEIEGGKLTLPAHSVMIVTIPK
jgi:alpha-N-arabinofuranosidase